jgi:disulfide bond formation protein DsbB
LYRANLLLDLEKKVREGAEAGCARFKGFPDWMPLERWLPDVFEPRAMCGTVSWTFLNQSVTFWIWTALCGLAFAALLVIVAQTRSSKRV